MAYTYSSPYTPPQLGQTGNPWDNTNAQSREGQLGQYAGGTQNTTITNGLKQVGLGLAQPNGQASFQLGQAQNAAYPFLANQVKNLSSLQGQQGLLDQNRNQLLGQSGELGNVAAQNAAYEGLGQGAQDAAASAAKQSALQQANSVQAMYSTPQGQMQAAQGVQGILQAMGQIPGLNIEETLQQLLDAHKQVQNQSQNSPGILGQLAGIAGTVLPLMNFGGAGGLAGGVGGSAGGGVGSILAGL